MNSDYSDYLQLFTPSLAKENTTSDVKSHVKYSTIKDQIQPFDLLFFKGNDIISKLIRIGEQYERGLGNFSHVGFVVTSEILPGLPHLIPGRIYVMESTISFSLSKSAPDVVSNKERFGVQIRDFEEVLNLYTKDQGTEVAWAPVINNPWINPEQRPDILKITQQFYNEYGRKRYELRLLELLAALFPWLKPVRNGMNQLILKGQQLLSWLHLTSNKNETTRDIEQEFVFCSELVTIMYQKLGLLDPKINPSDVVPIDLETIMPKLINNIIYLVPDINIP